MHSSLNVLCVTWISICAITKVIRAEVVVEFPWEWANETDFWPKHRKWRESEDLNWNIFRPKPNRNFFGLPTTLGRRGCATWHPTFRRCGAGWLPIRTERANEGEPHAWRARCWISRQCWAVMLFDIESYNDIESCNDIAPHLVAVHPILPYPGVN